jgi:type III secretion system FlhB-like substrate exporter
MSSDEKKEYKQLQRVLKQQQKAQKVYAKNTNKVAKEILNKNKKKDNGC